MRAGKNPCESASSRVRVQLETISSPALLSTLVSFVKKQSAPGDGDCAAAAAYSRPRPRPRHPRVLDLYHYSTVGAEKKAWSRAPCSESLSLQSPFGAGSVSRALTITLPGPPARRPSPITMFAAEHVLYRKILKPVFILNSSLLGGGTSVSAGGQVQDPRCEDKSRSA